MPLDADDQGSKGPGISCCLCQLSTVKPLSSEIMRQSVLFEFEALLGDFFV